MNLLHHIQAILRDTLTGYVPEVDANASLVKPTQDARFGDYQANCAMSLAKSLKKKPREIAAEIVARMPAGESLARPEIAGPGFINLRFDKNWLAQQLQEMAADDRLGVAPASQPKTIVIDYSSVNVAKPLHVGHLRSTIVGDSLARLFRFLGHKVVGDNHLGDWGTQFGMILHGYKSFLDQSALGVNPVNELARLYRSVRALMKKEEGIPKGQPRPVTEAAREETAKLHAGDPENVRLWKMFMPWCLGEINEIYQRLDVHFDHTLGESFYNDMLPGVVESLLQKGIATESEGAIGVFLNEDEPPALVRKSDGAFTYTTSDLATIQYRMEKWQPHEILYVVDFRQALHFKQLFATAKRWGFDKLRLEHISFGSVLGEDGKPKSTREGTGELLSELIGNAVAAANKAYLENRQERLQRGEEIPEFTEQELADLSEIVGIGAIKYADLSQNRASDYVFSLPKMLAMNGNTATYMQYAYVRNRGIFRKGDVDPESLRGEPIRPILESDNERALALQLLRFEEALAAGAADYQPSAITAYLWDLAKTYSSFFVNCPVLKANSPELKESRLLLCDLTARVIKKGLELLGIKTAERM